MFRILPVFLISACCFFSSASSAQAYKPFAKAGLMWTEAFRYNVWEPFSLHFCKLSASDTTINNLTHRKLYRSADTIFTETEFTGTIRDDSAGRKVWYLAKGSTHEKLMYDFSVQAGDTLKATANGSLNSWMIDMVVHSVDSLLLNGTYHRRINLRFAFAPAMTGLPSSMVEGVGNQVRGLLYNSGTLPNNGQWNELVCLHQDGFPVYHNSTDWGVADPGALLYPNCPVPEKQNVPQPATPALAQLYPNPLTESGVLLLSPAGGFTELRIYDALGRIVVSLGVKNKTEVPINRKDFTAGLYFYKLFTANGKSYRAGFICR